MHYQDRCPACDRPRVVEVHPQDGVITCPHCGESRVWPPETFRDGLPTCCLGCGNGDLWRQKDFPQGVGLMMVALGAILSSIAWAYHYPVLALVILGGFGLLDMVLFWVMPDVLVCYRCRARHRVGAAGTAFATYDHELGERYRQERLQLERAAGVSRTPHGV
jgi:hypothetical protein